MVKVSHVILAVLSVTGAAFALEGKRTISRRLPTLSSHLISKIDVSKGPAYSLPNFAVDSALETKDVSLVCQDSTATTKTTTFIDKIWNENTKLPVYLAVWYLGNIFYNIYNKKACMALGKNAAGASNIHWTLSAAQLAVGVLFVTPLWATGIRKSPSLTKENWQTMLPLGMWAALSHAFSVLAMGAGAVSFGQIVKAAEPVFAAATNALLLKDIDHPMVYMTLIPIIGGVGLASLKELSFTVTALVAALASNQAAAFKNVATKGVMKEKWANDLGPANMYACVTILALLCTLPLVALFDAKDFGSVYQSVKAAGLEMDVLKHSLLSGLAFYIYNEASFLALERLSPVTHSVANTLKRVVIIVTSCVIFNTPMSLMGGIGSGVAVAGTLMYSLAKKSYAKNGAKGGH